MKAPDPHRIYPTCDDHRRSPLLPPIVVLVGALAILAVVGCAWLGWL